MISTMVGLFIGLFALLSMVSLFKVQARQTIQTKGTTRIDGQISLGFVAAQLEMQKSGFGLEDTSSASNTCEGNLTPGRKGRVNQDFVMLKNASINAAGNLSGNVVTINPAGGVLATGNALVWHWNNGTTDQCSGLISQGGGLKLLQDIACTDATQWSTLTWPTAQVQDVVAVNTLNFIPKASTLNVDKSFSFSASMGSCAPFGRSTSAPALTVTTTAGQSMQAVAVSNDVCIPNICY